MHQQTLQSVLKLHTEFFIKVKLATTKIQLIKGICRLTETEQYIKMLLLLELN